MECSDFREIISACVDGEASESEVRAVEDHLAACPRCRSLAGKMRALGAGVGRIEGSVPPDFRDTLFARLEREDLLPRRRSLFVFSLRWTAIPLAAAAALALFLLTARDAGKGPAEPKGALPQVAQKLPGGGETAPADSGARPGAGTDSPVLRRPAGSPPEPQMPAGPSRLAASTGGGVPDLSAEEREIVAYLEVLEDPSALDEPGEVDEMELLEPSGKRRG